MIGVVAPAEPKPDEEFCIHQNMMLEELSLRLHQGDQLSCLPSIKERRLVVFALPMKPSVLH
jgi:hypothetical protein